MFKNFRLYRSRPKYWSCSNFADWIRKTFGGFSKPFALEWSKWNEWRDENKTKHKFVYWFTEEFLDHVQDVVLFVPDVYNHIRAYIGNRFFDKLHYLPTRLEPGQYYDLDTRLLHGNFEAFVDFVEVEKAWMQVVFDKEARKKYKYPLWSTNKWIRFKHFRCPEAGVDYLKWEMDLKWTENEVGDAHEMIGKPTWQAESAKEQYELYMWWKHTRPNRFDPYETIVGENVPGRFDACHKLEQAYDEEDEQMLIRLIKIRKTLWT